MLGLGLGLTSPVVMGGAAAEWAPIAGAAIDMDFVRQKYWWSGALKTTGDFTTFALNGSTLDATGLTPSTTVDITLTLPVTAIPGAMAVAFTQTGLPAGVRNLGSVDNGTTVERIQFNQTAGGLFNCTVTDNSVVQANPSGGTGALIRHGLAASYDTNNVLGAMNGVASTPDAAATMPTVTVLRVGKGVAASSNPTGIIHRVALFTAVKTQIELTALSVFMRDSA